MNESRSRVSPIRALAVAFSTVGLLGCENAAQALAGGLRELVFMAMLVAAVFVLFEIAGVLLVVVGALGNRRLMLAVGLAFSALALTIHLPASFRSIMEGRAGRDPIAATSLVPLAASFAAIFALWRGPADPRAGAKALLAAFGAAVIVGAAGTVLTLRGARAPEALPPTVTQLAIGRRHACAVFDDGKVRCGGANDAGQVGPKRAFGSRALEPISGVGRPRAIVAGDEYSCALVEQAVTCWGQLGFLRTGREASRTDIKEYGPTPLEGAANVVELHAGARSLAWRTADGKLVVRDATHGDATTHAVPADTAEIAAISSSSFCFRTSGGRVECRETHEHLLHNGRTVARFDDARRIAPTGWSADVCVERASSIGCYALSDGKPLADQPDVNALGEPKLTIDAQHLAMVGFVACGARGSTLVCTSTQGTIVLDDDHIRSGKPDYPSRSLDLGEPIDELVAGDGGLCARLRSRRFACIGTFDCFGEWLRGGACTPNLTATPITAERP